MWLNDTKRVIGEITPTTTPPKKNISDDASHLTVCTLRIKLFRMKMNLVGQRDKIKLDSWTCKSMLSFIKMKTHKNLGSVVSCSGNSIAQICICFYLMNYTICYNHIIIYMICIHQNIPVFVFVILKAPRTLLYVSCGNS